MLESKPAYRGELLNSWYTDMPFMSICVCNIFYVVITCLTRVDFFSTSQTYFKLKITFMDKKSTPLHHYNIFIENLSILTRGFNNILHELFSFKTRSKTPPPQFMYRREQRPHHRTGLLWLEEWNKLCLRIFLLLP